MTKNHTYMTSNNGLHRLNCTYMTEVWQITSDSNTLICKYLIGELIWLFSEQQALIEDLICPEKWFELIWIEIQDKLIWNSNQMQITEALPNLINSTYQLPTIIIIFSYLHGLTKWVRGFMALLVIWSNTYLGLQAGLEMYYSWS